MSRYINLSLPTSYNNNKKNRSYIHTAVYNNLLSMNPILVIPSMELPSLVHQLLQEMFKLDINANKCFHSNKKFVENAYL